MKFKKSGSSCSCLEYLDYAGDSLEIAVRRDDAGGPRVYIKAGEGGYVSMGRKRAIKLALAILDELDPTSTW
jgi:hypothetical protein